ncbi:MAG: DUF2189 domain-containing protein [Proteobacteria bacterium]|nr:DUF2189 domain-containing protein [Pseudomonadota bacterium]MBS0574789.1 DUF2189 domain-containing protein [Pseudomonadota bacterium]
MDDIDSGPADLPEPGRIGAGAIGAALAAGVRDYLRAPLFGLFFSAVYVAGGLFLWFVATRSGQEWWLIPMVAGFPLLAPFAAVGLYEVSRRIEAGAPLDWRGVLGVVFAQKDRQLPSLAAVILVIFLFWLFVGHALFALFIGLSPQAMAAGGLADYFLTGRGPLMLAIGTGIGAGFAFVLFCMTVVGLPMLLEREVDFVTAAIVSFQAVFANLGVMILWAGAICLLLAIGMAPLFLGLFVVLPVLGHASWHMYRALMA